MKYCSKCGNQLLDDAIICTNCGCAVEPQQTVSQHSNSDITDSNMPSGNPPLCKITGIISTVLGILSAFSVPLGMLTIGIISGITPPLIVTLLIGGAIFGIAGIVLGIISTKTNAYRNTFTFHTDKRGNQVLKPDYNLGARAMVMSIFGFVFNLGVGVMLFIML